MHWIALRWLPPEVQAAADASPGSATPGVEALGTEALGWWALQFTPHVAWLDEALLLEVSACERLWGGRLALMRELERLNPVAQRLQRAQGASSLVALARLRLFARGVRPPVELPGGLPLDTLSAARPHLAVLERLGCRSWGDVAGLPRGGVVRRFGGELRDALDVAWGRAPDQHVWLTLPEVFDLKFELPALAENAAALMWSANRLLAALQVWLRARQRGALAIELQWTLDLRRFNGVDLPPREQIIVRTAAPTQDMAHLRRLLHERLALTRLGAPASWLRLRSVETAPWAGASTSFLPEDNRKGDRLHELVERLGARLGAQQVVVPVPQADHRPEHMQSWLPAHQAALAGPARAVLRRRGKAAAAVAATQPSAAAAPAAPPNSAVPGASPLYPPWLLREPLALDVREGHPHYQGKLSRLVGPQRLETGWWADGQPAVRDYFIAESPGAGLVWIFRERPSGWLASEAPRWFLQGLYG